MRFCFLSLARLDATCGSRALAESEPLIRKALAMLLSQRPRVTREGNVAEARSNNEHITRHLDGMPLLVSLFAFATDIFPKLQADIRERVNLLHFANLALTFSNRARPESRRLASRLGHGALATLASDPLATGRMGELRDKSPSHYDLRLPRRIFGIPSSRILSILCYPTACASFHLSVQGMWGAFESAGVDMPDDA
jgi:hypothetical protein